MNRWRVRAGNAACAAVAFVAAFGAAPSRAAAVTPNLWFEGTRLIFDRADSRAGDLAVTSADSGLATFLQKSGATLGYSPGQNYVVVTAADHREIVFTLGDTRYSNAGAVQAAPFAPSLTPSGAIVLPFFALARALYFEPVQDGGATVLQPQLGSLEVRVLGKSTFVTLHGATALLWKRLSDDAAPQVTLVFWHTATSLDRSRSIAGGLLRAIGLDVQGSPRVPKTLVTFDVAPGAARLLLPSDSPNTVRLAFAPPGVVTSGVPLPVHGDEALAAAPSENAPSAPAMPAAQVTSLGVEPLQAGLDVRVGLSGDVDYEWHRLADGRWYLDFKNAQLAAAPADQQLDGSQGVAALRMRQMGTIAFPAVRVALSLTSQRAVWLVPSAGGVTIHVDGADDPASAPLGVGRIVGGEVVAQDVSPSASATPEAEETPWKFGPRGAPSRNGRLIVIDPGHGGSDTGAMHNGVVEKDVALDISKRLRAVLIERGWQVILTRDTDTDVYQPNDSAHDELQARCDLANSAGARMFVSVHGNGSYSPSVNGTTTYYFRSDSLPLAQAVHDRLAATLPTKDDGILKENFYVIHHTTMPAILVETAFLSNAADAALLKSSAFLQKVALGIADGIGDAAGAVPDPSGSGGS
jgi:N-acetylmuramoyl-L-alanine amidase